MYTMQWPTQARAVFQSGQVWFFSLAAPGFTGFTGFTGFAQRDIALDNSRCEGNVLQLPKAQMEIGLFFNR